MSTLKSECRDLLDAIMDNAARQAQPAAGHFELTSRCNLACKMCYIQEAEDDSVAAAQELTPQQWLRIAEEAYQCGMFSLCLTGGEPLLREDFFEIYEPLSRMGVILVLFTNGTLVTPEVAARLAQAPPHRLEVTIYGATAETYERVTGVSDSFARCIAGIENLLSVGIPNLLVKTTVTRLNLHEVEAMIQMAEGWGVPFGFNPLITCRRDGRESEASSIRMIPQEYFDLLKLMKSHGYSRPDDPSTPTESQRTQESPVSSGFYCTAGLNSFVVTASGELNVCMDLPLPAAKPLEVGFAEAWRQVVEFRNSVPEAPTCARCGMRNYCPRCPGWSFAETKSLMKPVPYLCELSREYYRRRAQTKERAQ
jgi:radical SAM protein with 4Fe4S-binding SPASM domain